MVFVAMQLTYIGDYFDYFFCKISKLWTFLSLKGGWHDFQYFDPRSSCHWDLRENMSFSKLDLKFFQKQHFSFFQIQNFTQYWCPRQSNFTPFGCPRQPNFTPFWCPQQPNFTPFGCPRQTNFTPFRCPRQPNFTPFRCPRQLVNEYIVLAMPWPLEQLSGTHKPSKIWLSGTSKRSKIWLSGTPKPSKIWLSGTRHSKSRFFCAVKILIFQILRKKSGKISLKIT